MSTIAKFETGKTYKVRSIGDHNCVWTYEIIRRTAQTIRLMDEAGKAKTCRVRVVDGEEVCYPDGRYSMCPVLRATNITRTRADIEAEACEAEWRNDNALAANFFSKVTV